MKALFVISSLAFLLFIAGAESLLTILGPVWFLVLGLGLLGTLWASSRG